MAKRKRKSTRTSAFGSPGRTSHDSSDFYESRLYTGQASEQASERADNAFPDEITNRILLKSSEQMTEIPDRSVHLMVTSPPYNVQKEYDQDLTLEEYRGLLRKVFAETYRVLVNGGRACVNVANLGRKPYLPIHAFLIQDLLELGFLMRGEIIWDKASSASPSTAWGSWQSASNPVLRDVHEYILVFSKESFARSAAEAESSITREDFLELTRSVWTFPAESARRVGHPAPFPEELPRRLIELYTFCGDVVLDPFCGSGTTCVAASRSARRFIGYEVDPAYLKLAQARLAEISTQHGEEPPAGG